MANAMDINKDKDLGFTGQNRGGQGQSQPAGQVAEKAKELASAVSDKSKELASAVAQAATGMAKDAASTVAQRASDVAATVGRKAEDATASVGGGMKTLAQNIRDKGPQEGMMGSAKAHYECIKAFSETDFTEDLKAIDVPTLVIHSEDDQIVPYADSGPLAAKLLKQGTLITYKDLPHGCLSTHPEILNRDILGFIRSEAVTPPVDSIIVEPIPA